MLFFNKAFFKILIAVIACGVVQASAAGWLHAGIEGGSIGNITGNVGVSALNMRRCPDTSCPIIKILNRGDRVRIIEKSGGWLEIRYREHAGYVYDAAGYVRRGGSDVSDLASARETAETIKKRLSEKKGDVSKMDRRAANAAEALEEIDKSLSRLQKDLKQVRRDTDEIDERMKKTEADIANTRAAIRENKMYAEKRLVALYKLNRLGGMNLLASADSTSDLFRRKAALASVLDRDETVIEGLVEAERRLEDLRAQAAEEKARKEKLENQYKQGRAELARKKAQRENLLAEIKSQKSEALSEIEYLEQAARRMDQTIDALKKRPDAEKTAGKGTEGNGGKADTQKRFSEYQGLLKMPVNGTIASLYGKYKEPNSGATAFKNGIEIEAKRGTPVKAVFDGEAAFSDWLTGFGRVIIVSHGNSYYTVYGYLEEMMVSEGDAIEAGQTIATVGESGSISGPVLYFEVRHKGNPLNPLDWIEKG